MTYVIYLPTLYYDSHGIKNLRSQFWNVEVYSSRKLFGIFGGGYVVPITTSPSKTFLEHICEQHGVDVLAGAGKKSVAVLATSQEETSVEIFNSPFFEVERSINASMATKVRVKSGKFELQFRSTEEN